jgi:hypothetical protein
MKIRRQVIRILKRYQKEQPERHDEYAHAIWVLEMMNEMRR